ncbi:hypothetical protein MVES_000066 [Malassezia vespertilionis]|uniref:Uncharacterized protein n=1 Tax=Malassezia vespertilionis TaxID=2020962 RepID=A0A2N1JG14_9BASI|nr:hypothetical protein MVES_000066 [Malassezia vespertilionis]
MASPTRPRFGMRTPMRLAGTLGLVGGFLLAYQRSSFRFWGWSENEREVERAKKDKEAGKVIGRGESSLSDEMQGAAFRNSLYSQLNFAVLPWFNFVNHKFHDTPSSSNAQE